MGDAAQGFQHHEARLGIVAVGAAREDIARQLDEIGSRIVARRLSRKPFLPVGVP